MRSLFRHLPVLLLGVVPASIARCGEPALRPEIDVANVTAREVWAHVVARNRVWLQPTAKNLSYVAVGKSVGTENPEERMSSRVWVSGRLARWQMLEAHFRKVKEYWLLDQAYNIHGGKRIREMVVSEVSTEPIAPAVFDPSEP